MSDFDTATIDRLVELAQTANLSEEAIAFLRQFGSVEPPLEEVVPGALPYVPPAFVDVKEDHEAIVIRGPWGTLKGRVISGRLAAEILWGFCCLEHPAYLQRILRKWDVFVSYEEPQRLHISTYGAAFEARFERPIPRQLSNMLRDIFEDHNLPGTRSKKMAEATRESGIQSRGGKATAELRAAGQLGPEQIVGSIEYYERVKREDPELWQRLKGERPERNNRAQHPKE